MLVQVHTLRNPTLQHVTQAIKEQRPTLLYLSSGIAILSSGAGLDDISLQPLQFKDGKGAPVSKNHWGWLAFLPIHCGLHHSAKCRCGLHHSVR